MNTTTISELLASIGVSPNYKGYSSLVYLVDLSTTYNGQVFPRMKDLYQQTAEHLNISASNVEYNVRTIIKRYWNQDDSWETFCSVTHYHLTYNLTTKEFVSVLADYVTRHS